MDIEKLNNANGEVESEVYQNAVDHGFYEPQCEHTDTLKGSLMFEWCRDCGGLRTNTAEWILPKAATQDNIGEKFMLMVTELSEAYEAWRIGLSLNKIYYDVGYALVEEGLCSEDQRLEGKPEGPAIELADVEIRLRDFVKRNRIPLNKSVVIKHEYNKGRPHRHGGRLS